VGVLLVSCALASIDVFVDQGRVPLLQFFLYGLLWTLQLLIVALYLPYDSFKRNVQNVLVGFATLTHSAIFLGVQQGGVSSGYMVALLLLFAAVLVVLLFREKLAIGVPWLRVLRRADLEKQEAEIIEAAEEVDRQLARALSGPARQPSRSVSSASSGPHHLVVASSPTAVTSEGAGQPDGSGASNLALGPDAAAPQLTLQLEPAFLRELAARAQRDQATAEPTADADTPGSLTLGPASPSQHQRGASLGPGQLFVLRASAPVATGQPARNDTDESKRPSRGRIGGAMQLSPLQPVRTNGVRVHGSLDELAVSSMSAALPPIRSARGTPSARLLAPHSSKVSGVAPTATSSPSESSHVPVVLPDRVLDEHDPSQLDASHAHEHKQQHV
jgi:hypothetical protein